MIVRWYGCLTSYECTYLASPENKTRYHYLELSLSDTPIPIQNWDDATKHREKHIRWSLDIQRHTTSQVLRNPTAIPSPSKLTFTSLLFGFCFVDRDDECVVFLDVEPDF